MRKQGTIVTNSSWVYEEPCAEHVVAMMLSLARRLPEALDDQRGPRKWRYLELRAKSHLLLGQTAVIIGFGSIGRRIAEILSAFKMNLIAVRRTVRGDEKIRTVELSKLDEVLPLADHVIDVLPGSPQTDELINANRIARMKRGAIFYNIGRGTTVDQVSLQTALETNHLAAAYLDVTMPEPLPKDHPLWEIPNCYITSHMAGGHHDEYERLVEHFVENLKRFENREELRDRII
jgi:phosphoglycerate dehydrogenase-like enzyme